MCCAVQVIKMRVSQGALKRGCFAPQVRRIGNWQA